jgi:hypothetical protein
VREIFEGTGVELAFDRQSVDFHGDSIEEFVTMMETSLPPLAAAKAALQPEGKWQALRDDIVAMDEEINEADDGSLRYAGEYLVAKGTKG